MYDVHCHVLYGVDDGPNNIEDSLSMCRAAEKDRIKVIAATPHFIEGITTTSPSIILERIHRLNQRLKEENTDLLLVPGMEVYMTPNLINLYEEGRIITINQKKYLLIEFPVYIKNLSYLENTLFTLQIKGVKPLIAHPERYKAVIKEPEIVFDLIDRGCLMQINSGSLEGLYGKDVQKTAFTLLKSMAVHVIATDSHFSNGKPGLLRNTYRSITKKFGKNVSDELLIHNPLKIINGEDISVREPDPFKKKKFLFI